MYRQGDVLLVKIQEIIPDEAERFIWEDRVVLAYGEVTGHTHSLPNTISMYSWKGDRLIEVKETTPLTHEEHSTILIEPGIYKVVQQREYHPAEYRQVRD